MSENDSVSRALTYGEIGESTDERNLTASKVDEKRSYHVVHTFEEQNKGVARFDVRM